MVNLPKLKQLFVNISLLCISIAVVLIIAEIAVRSFLPQYVPRRMIGIFIEKGELSPTTKNYKGNQWNGRCLVEVKCNRHGFRDVKDIADSTYGDIFVVGDSFGFGWGVREDERYSNVLETLLNRSVYNISVPADIKGYQWLVEYAVARGARVNNLVVGICMENDLKVYEKKNYQSLIDSSAKGKNILISTKKYLKRNFSLCRFIADRIDQNKKRLLSLMYRIGLIEPKEIFRYKHSRQVVESSTAMVLNLARQFKVIVLIVPSRMLWAGDEISRDKESKIHDEFVKILQNKKIETVDMRRIFEKSNNPMQCHTKVDHHWTEEAHTLAAKELYKLLSKKDFS